MSMDCLRREDAVPVSARHAAAMESDLTKICGSLIEYAKQRGGADNITCILLKALPAQAQSAMAQSNADSHSV